MRSAADSPIDRTNPLGRKELAPPVCLIFTSEAGRGEDALYLPSLWQVKQQDAFLR